MSALTALARFLQNLQKWSKIVLEWSKSIFQVFLTVTHLLDHFWNPLDTFEKKRAKGHVSLLPGLVRLVLVHSALAYQRILKGLDH